MTLAGEVDSVLVQKCARSSPSGNLIHRSCLLLLYSEIEQIRTFRRTSFDEFSNELAQRSQCITRIVPVLHAPRTALPHPAAGGAYDVGLDVMS